MGSRAVPSEATWGSGGGGLRAAGTCAVFVAGETPERSRRIKDEPCLCAGDRLLTEGVALLLVVRVNLKHPRRGLTRFCSLPLARVPAENCALWRRGRFGGGEGGKAVRAEFIHGIHLQFNGPGSNV